MKYFHHVATYKPFRGGLVVGCERSH